MASFCEAPGLGGLDIMMHGRGKALGRYSRQRLDIDESVSLHKHVWKEARHIETNLIDVEVSANGTYLYCMYSTCTILLIILITLPPLPTYLSVITATWLKCVDDYIEKKNKY